jgi:hypothetical protein
LIRRTLEEIDESLDGKKHFGAEGEVVYGVDPIGLDERSSDENDKKDKIVPQVYSMERLD